MKVLLSVLTGIFLLFIPASLSAGEVIIYGGMQKPGELRLSDDILSLPEAIRDLFDDLKGDFGGTFGLRYSHGRVIGFEQSIGFSPRFAKPGLRAFQMDSNLVIQAPGNIVPYGTVGIGFVRTWGQDLPSDPGEFAAFVFNIGSNFAVNYGGGLKIRRLAGPFGLNIDVRGYTLPGVIREVGFPGPGGDVSVTTQKGLKFIQTTAGLVINW